MAFESGPGPAPTFKSESDLTLLADAMLYAHVMINDPVEAVEMPPVLCTSFVDHGQEGSLISDRDCSSLVAFVTTLIELELLGEFAPDTDWPIVFGVVRRNPELRDLRLLTPMTMQFGMALLPLNPHLTELRTLQLVLKCSKADLDDWDEMLRRLSKMVRVGKTLEHLLIKVIVAADIAATEPGTPQLLAAYRAAAENSPTLRYTRLKYERR